MKRSLIVLTIIFFFFLQSGFSQVRLIFDTDLGGDADDLGALVMLHHFIDRNECELLGIMCWSTEQYAISAIDAVNRFYNHPEIPVGIRKGETYYEPWCYSKSIADKLPHQLTHESVPDATELYREVLAQSDDHSVVIVTVGPLMNIQNLIKSVPDDISDLSGKELIDKKVREFVMMGGQFPEGEDEWNFNGNMPGVTRFVIQNISVPITFSGFEVGKVIKTGEVFNELDKDTPLYLGFYHFSKNAPWMKENFKGIILDNASYDQTAVLYAVRNGEGIYWEKVEGGLCNPDDHGGNRWIKDPDANHSYLRLKKSPEEMAQLIESIMLNDF